jgi:YVTN family beta-propeller protein
MPIESIRIQAIKFRLPRAPATVPWAALAPTALLLLTLIAPGPSQAQTVSASVATGPDPVGIAVNAVTNKIYVISSGTAGRVTVIDGATNTTTAVTAGMSPSAVAVNTVTNKVYVANSASNDVTVIDGASNATSTVALGGTDPQAIAVDEATDSIYVMNAYELASELGGNLTMIDGATNATTSIPGGISNPLAIAVNPVTDKIYVANLNFSGSVSVIDGATSTNPDINIALGSFPVAIAVNTVTDTIYAANVKDDKITVINGATNANYAVGLGDNYTAIAVNTLTNKAYAVCSDTNGYVSVVDGASRIVSVVSTGSYPGAVAVDEATNAVYVTNSGDGTVSVIDGSTNTASTLAVGQAPFAVVMNPVTNKVYVLNNDANGTVSVIDGLPAEVAPIITGEPQPKTVNAGSSVVFNAAATGRPSATYRWSFDGVPLSDGDGISGSTTSTLLITGGVSQANAGNYTVTATNGSGSATSTAAALTVVDTATPGRIINISARGVVDSGGLGIPSDLTAGFVIGGQGSKTVLLRGIGPTLGAFGVPYAMAIPVLSLFDAANPPNLITGDMGWQSPPSAPAGPWAGRAAPVDATAADFAQVGAFALAAGSADCSVKVALPVGAYTSQISGTGTPGGPVDNGVALAEVYDADPANPGAQLINISTRAFVGTGGNVLITGFVIAGSSAQTVLIRGAGPALAALEVPFTLPDPLLELFDSNQNLIASNFGWGGNPQIASVASSVGAFPWSDPASSDSALLITLPPGNYTAQVVPQSGDAGTALIEVYAVP